jgi:hypothetical protein
MTWTPRTALIVGFCFGIGWHVAGALVALVFSAIR